MLLVKMQDLELLYSYGGCLPLSFPGDVGASVPNTYFVPLRIDLSNYSVLSDIWSKVDVYPARQTSDSEMFT